MKLAKPLHLFLPVFLAVIALVVIYPLMNLLWSGVAHLEKGSLEIEHLWGLVQFTYGQAFLSSVCAAIVGCSFALFHSEFEFLGKSFLWKFCSLSFSMPTLVMILALVGIWGKSGWLGFLLGENGFYGWRAILLAHTLFNFPLFSKMVGQALMEKDRTEEKVALSLGLSRFACFFKITFRKVLPELKGAFTLSFLYCSSSLVVLLLLGGGPRFSSLEVGIFQAIKVDLNIPMATLYAVIQLGVCLGVQLLHGNLERSTMQSHGRSTIALYYFQSRSLNGIVKIVAMGGFIVLVLLPFVQLVASGLLMLGRLEFGELSTHLFSSLLLAVRVGVIGLVFGFLAAYSQRHCSSKIICKGISLLCELPVALSTMILGLALILSYPSLYFQLRSGLWGAVLIQVILSLPLVFRTLRDGYFRIERELDWTAQSLGAGLWDRLYYLEFPLLKRSVVTALVLSVGLSLGEVGSLLLFESLEHTPLSLWLYRLMGTYRFEAAQGVGMILLLLMGILFFIVGKWER